MTQVADTQAPDTQDAQDDALLAELIAMRAERDAAIAAKQAAEASLAAAAKPAKAAFVPVVSVTMREPGYDRFAHEPNRAGMFVTQTRKLIVSVTRSSGKDVELDAPPAVWSAIVADEALALIRKALA